MKSSTEVLYDYLISMLGVPYKYGGNNRLTGLDCSGLVIDFKKAEGKLPFVFDTNAQGLYDHFTRTGSKIRLVPQFGDLAFYGKDLNTGIIHVAICLTTTLMIEAGGGNSSTRDLDTAKINGAMVRIKHINFRKDYLTVIGG